MQLDQHKLLIHKDGKDSPVIATVDMSQAKEGSLVAEFADPPAKVEMHHVPHKLPWTHSNTYFTYEGKKYHWKAYSALIEDDTRTCIATFHTVNLGGPRRKHGSLVLVHDSTKMRDLAAVTRLAALAQADELKLEVLLPIFITLLNFLEIRVFS